MDEPVVFIISDRYDVEEVADWTGEEPRCTRKKLWAAIVAWVSAESEAIERGYNDDAFNDRAARSRERVRHLLGLEGE